MATKQVDTVTKGAGRSLILVYIYAILPAALICLALHMMQRVDLPDWLMTLCAVAAVPVLLIALRLAIALIIISVCVEILRVFVGF